MPALEITTVIGCPLMCNVCPQDKLIKNYKDENKKLKYEDFKIIINKLPKNVRIDFSGMSEPWINDDCNKMLEYTLENKYRVAIYTTLVGLTSIKSDIFCNLIKKYKHLIEILCIHLPDKNNNMRGWKYTNEYENVLQNVLQFKNEIFFQSMTMDINGNVNDSIKHIDTKLVPWNINWEAITRADSLTLNDTNRNITKKSPNHFNSISCASTKLYDRNVILPNGDVYLCCMDYSLKHKLGNLLKQNYESLFTSEELLKIIKINKNPEFSKCSICKSCTNVVYT